MRKPQIDDKIVSVDFESICGDLMSLMKVIVIFQTFSNVLYVEITGYGGWIVLMCL